MNSMITIGISGIEVVKGGEQPVTYALGSYVDICLYGPLREVSGLGRIMLPKYPAGNPKENKYRFADTCITEMLRETEQLGAPRTQLTAEVARDTKMLEVPGDSTFGNTGQRNAMAVRAILAYEKIPIKAQDTGLNYGRTLYFTTDDDVMTIKSFVNGVKVH